MQSYLVKENFEWLSAQFIRSVTNLGFNIVVTRISACGAYTACKCVNSQLKCKNNLLYFTVVYSSQTTEKDPVRASPNRSGTHYWTSRS